MVTTSKAGIVAVMVLLATSAHFSSLHAEEPTRSQRVMEEIWGEMIGAEWRTPNPDFDEPDKNPLEYAIRWRWDEYRQYAIGELVGVFRSGGTEREVRYWNLYAFHNAVTDEVTGMQIGWDGSIASGPMRRTADGGIVLDQILYHADGSLKAIRHEEIMQPDGAKYRSNVYERDVGGEWALVRQWTWAKSLRAVDDQKE